MKSKIFKLLGIITLLISLFLFWYCKDIFEELFEGRPFAEIQFRDLLFPVILLIISIYLIIFKQPQNEK